ncbi:MAG: hypothetical protein RL135_431 [Bacteroidota bacterium]|jgi:DNA-binding NarL/FixJ family response regulator
MIRVAVVDDVTANRVLIREKLVKSNQFSLIITAVDGVDFLDQMKRLEPENYPHIVLMDLEMPNMDGIATIATGSSLYPYVKFVVLTIFDEEDKIFNAIKAGSYGYLLKDESSEFITESLLQIHEAGIGPVSPGIAFKILQLLQQKQTNTIKTANASLQTYFDLTEREMQIVQLLAKALSYKEIGEQLNISVNTAKKHVIKIYEKLHVNTRAQALKLMYDKKLL